MEGKTVSESAVVMAQVMGPSDLNIAGNVHGGTIMKSIEAAASVVAIRHSRTNSVMASVDRLDFHYPAFSGDLITCKASLNLVGKSSMEVGVRVEAENLFTGEVRHTVSAYLTYVALDKSGRPTQIPSLILETDDDRRRNQEAQTRRDTRIQQKNEVKK
jgi:acyl-CoA hydrolase